MSKLSTLTRSIPEASSRSLTNGMSVSDRTSGPQFSCLCAPVDKLNYWLHEFAHETSALVDGGPDLPKKPQRTDDPEYWRFRAKNTRVLATETPLIRCVIGHYRSQRLSPWRSLRRTDYVVGYDERVGRYFAAGALLSDNLVLILVLVNDNADAARVSFVSKSEESFADFRLRFLKSSRSYWPISHRLA